MKYDFPTDDRYCFDKGRVVNRKGRLRNPKEGTRIGVFEWGDTAVVGVFHLDQKAEFFEI
jgi:hypothetical protein